MAYERNGEHEVASALYSLNAARSMARDAILPQVRAWRWACAGTLMLADKDMRKGVIWQTLVDIAAIEAELARLREELSRYSELEEVRA